MGEGESNREHGLELEMCQNPPECTPNRGGAAPAVLLQAKPVGPWQLPMTPQDRGELTPGKGAGEGTGAS